MLNDLTTAKGAIPVHFDPFKKGEIQAVAPVTEPQSEIWAACMIGGADASRAYNESVSLQLEGQLDHIAFKQAVNQLIQRHDALRATFSADGRMLVVYREANVEAVFEDIAELNEEEQSQFIIQDAHSYADTAFDLVNGPLVRCSLIRLSAEKHRFTLCAHHIICDGWSLGVLINELSLIYNGLASSTGPQLPEPSSFSRYAKEQWQLARTAAYEASVSYWQQRYADGVPVTNIPVDHRRPAQRTYSSHRDDFPVDPAMVARLKKEGMESGCSMVISLLAAFEVFLQKLCGAPDVIVGLPASGQVFSGNTSLVGHCVNLLPVRSKYKGELTFRQYLALRKDEILEDIAHQRITLGKLLQLLNIPRDTSRVPMVPVVFNIDMDMDMGVHFTGVAHKLIINPRYYEHFEIFLNVSGTEQALMFEWSYNAHILSGESIKKMMRAFTQLLFEVTENPLLRLDEIRITEQADNFTAIKAGRTPRVPFDNSRTFVHLFREAATKYPDMAAVVQGERTITYKYLNDKSDRIAAYYQSVGIKKGEIVAVALDRNPDLVISLLALLKTGAAWLPVDTTYPQVRLNYMLEKANSRYILATRELTLEFDKDVTVLFVEDTWKRSLDFAAINIDHTITGNDLAYVMYTSGSTGKPKGVAIEHHSLLNFLLAMQQSPGIAAGDRVLAITTFTFDISCTELFAPLIGGATIVLADAVTARDGRLILETIKQERITLAQSTPSLWRLVMEAGWEKQLPVKIISGGEVLPEKLATALLSKCAGLWNMYGPTECTVWATMKHITAKEPQVTLGKPIRNVNIYLLDEYRRPVPHGAEGTIYIGGEAVGRGYINDPELTFKSFVDDPFGEPGDKMYNTGDLGRMLTGGEIQFLGRVDNQLKLRGRRIEPSEIEANLTDLKNVNAALVMAKGGRLVAYVIPQQPVSDEAEQMAYWKIELKRMLPQYMVPDEFHLVEKLPVTEHGKIERKPLPEVTPEPKAPRKVTPPSNDTERAIYKIWQGLLEVEELDIQDNFFDMGGHSMMAIQAVIRMEKETGHKLPVSAIFEYPTIKQLAEAAGRSHEKPVAGSLVPLKPSGHKTPLYVVHGYNMSVLTFNNVAKHMDQEQPVYGLQPKLLEDINSPLATIEEIARDYVAEIVSAHAPAEVSLAGYSFGGYIAFEMTRQLTALGVKVRNLNMFDAYAYETEEDDGKKTGKQVPKMLFIMGSFIRQPISTLKQQAEAVTRSIKNIIGAPADEFDNETDAKVFERYDYAFSNYKMKPQDIAIDVFRVRNRLNFLDDPKYLGWKPWTRKAVLVHNIPGDHKTFILPPNNKVFAGILQDVLDKAK